MDAGLLRIRREKGRTMFPSSKEYVLVGVDGGATEVKVHEVLCDAIESPTSFVLGNENAARVYPRVPDFEPVPLEQQLADRDAEQATPDEDKQGDLLIASAADAIEEVVVACGERPIIAGMGMPGLKTRDGRGIAVINNGPRMPKFLDKLEKELTTRGLVLRSPIARLGSDADYCGLGEQWAIAGMLRDVDSGYYVGCGTGVADAMKLRGDLVTFDSAQDWIQKAWQLLSPDGVTYEKLVSAKSMNAGYAKRIDLPADGASAFPERDALDGKPEAIAWLNEVAEHLALLIVERIDTIKNGRRAAAWRGEAYQQLNPDHPFRGVLLDRIVIGQRLGQIYADEDCRKFFGAQLDFVVADEISASGDTEMIEWYLQGDKVKPGRICASKLRAAPALGAAVAAALKE